MASTVTNSGSSRDAVDINALICQRAELHRKLKMKHCENNALKEHLKSLMEEKATLEREGQAKLDRLNTLKRLHQARKNELARNLKMKAMLKSCIDRDSDVSSDEENVEIPDLDQLKLAKNTYEEELKNRKWLDELHQAKIRAEHAENEKLKIKERYDEELKLFHEAYDKLDRYQKLNYHDFILESVITAKKIHDQKKKLAVLLVRNAKFNSTTDDSLEEDCKSPDIIKHSHVDTPRPPSARSFQNKENVEKVASQQKGYSSDTESVVAPQINSQAISLVSDYSSQGHRSNEVEEEDIMEEDQQDMEENNESQVEEEDVAQSNESQEDSVVIVDDDEHNRSDSVLIHDDKSFEEQNKDKENREDEEMEEDEGFGFHINDDINNSIIIDDNEEKDDSFKLGDSLPLTGQGKKDVKGISPKSPVFAVPKIPEKKLSKKKESEPIFNIEDTSFSFSNFDPTKNVNDSQNGDILGQIIDTSINSADPAVDFLNLASNSGDNDTHDGGFNFNLFNSDDAEENGDDIQFNFSLANSVDKNENNFFGF